MPCKRDRIFQFNGDYFEGLLTVKFVIMQLQKNILTNPCIFIFRAENYILEKVIKKKNPPRISETLFLVMWIKVCAVGN